MSVYTGREKHKGEGEMKNKDTEQDGTWGERKESLAALREAVGAGEGT